jgi:hypothetical protein
MDKEELIWNGLRRAGFVGVVDNFDESEHSSPYGTWRGSDDSRTFTLERATDVVKEGKRSLRVRYNVPADATNQFFAVQQGRKDFSPYRFLTFWVCHDPGMEPVLIAQDGASFPLAESARRTVPLGWSRRYFEIPEEARSKRIEEVRFLVNHAAVGTVWLDGILLTHEIPSNEVDFVLDDFEATRSTWSPGSAYRIEVVSEVNPAGTPALRIDFAKSGDDDRGKAISVDPVIKDWSRFHSVALWVRGGAAIRLRLADGAGRSFDVGTYTPAAETGWRHVFFNIQANLNPSNCWEPRYDKRDIREMLFLVEPGKTDCRGQVCFSSIMLTE